MRRVSSLCISKWCDICHNLCFLYLKMNLNEGEQKNRTLNLFIDRKSLVFEEGIFLGVFPRCLRLSDNFMLLVHGELHFYILTWPYHVVVAISVHSCTIVMCTCFLCMFHHTHDGVWFDFHKKHNKKCCCKPT